MPDFIRQEISFYDYNLANSNCRHNDRNQIRTLLSIEAYCNGYRFQNICSNIRAEILAPTNPLKVGTPLKNVNPVLLIDYLLLFLLPSSFQFKDPIITGAPR